MGVENVTKDHAREMVVGLRELTHLLERFMANEDPVKPASGNVYQFKAQRKRR